MRWSEHLLRHYYHHTFPFLFATNTLSGCNLAPSLDLDISVVSKNPFLILILDGVQCHRKKKTVFIACLKDMKHQHRAARLGRSMIYQCLPPSDSSRSSVMLQDMPRINPAVLSSDHFRFPPTLVFPN